MPAPSRRWNDAPLRVKVLAIMSVPLLALVSAATAFLLVGRQANATQDAVVEALGVRDAAQAVDSAMQNLDTLLWSSSLLGQPLGTGLAKAQESFEQSVAALRQKIGGDPVQLAALDGFESKVDRANTTMRTVVDQIMAEIKRTGALPDLSGFFDNAAETMAPDLALATVQQTAEDRVEQRTAQARAARDRVQVTVLAGAGLGTAGGIALVFFAIGGMVRRLERVAGNARRLADGETLAPINPARDEIGQLAHEIEEAAALLAHREREMVAAKEEAERSNHAKTEFLSRMSHELRTPLNSVLGFAQLITMGEAAREDRDSADQIMRAGRHLLGLIDEVLDISRIEGGRLRMSMEPVPVGDALIEAIDLVRPLAERSAVTILLDDAGGAWALADRQRLNQVFLNLLSNAIKFNRVNGAVDVRVAANGEAVSIEVADTGRGIAPADLGRLFVPFERLDADSLDVEGTGLGLALTKRLVEAMDGTIDVRSAPGEGTTFTVRLHPSAPVEMQPKATERRRTRPSRAERGEPVVLYVEDNLANLRLVERILGQIASTRLITAMQGGLGVELARQQRPDLILLDLHLPDIHGGEVLRILKADPATQDIPVVVITADATGDARDTVLRGGAHACMTKPLDVIPFIECVETVLSASRAVA